MKSILLVLAVCFAQEGDNPTKSEASVGSPVFHTAVVEFREFAVGEKLMHFVYPQLDARVLEERKAIELRGELRTVEEAEALLAKLNDLGDRKQWAAFTVPANEGEDKFSELLTAETGVPVELQHGKVLATGSKEQIDQVIKFASMAHIGGPPLLYARSPNSGPIEREFQLKHALATDVARTITETFTTASTRIVSERKLWVTVNPQDKRAVEVVIAALDRPAEGQNVAEATFRVSRVADMVLLTRELYPSVECKKTNRGPDNFLVRGNKTTLKRIENLIASLGILQERNHQWSLMTVSDHGADNMSDTLRRAMPDLMRHVGETNSLLLIGGTQDDIKEATEFLELSKTAGDIQNSPELGGAEAHGSDHPAPDGGLGVALGDMTGLTPVKPDGAATGVAEQPKWTVLYLQNASAREASTLLRQLLSGVRVVPEPRTNALFVTGSDAQIREVEATVRVLDASELPQRTNRPKPAALDDLAGLRARGQQIRDRVSAKARAVDASPTGKAELERMVREQFQHRQEIHLAELQGLKSKLAELESRIAMHEKFKEQMIQRRVESLIADPGQTDRQTSSTTAMPRKTAKKGELYKLQAGDTLGLYIENVLGTDGVTPPIHEDPTGVRAPVMGYPIPVRGDGTISLPLIKPITVAGLTLPLLEAKLRDEYCVKNDILLEEKTSMFAALIRSIDDRPAQSTSPQTIKTPTASRRTSGKIAPGDTLGLIIEQILGNGDEPAPIHTDPTGNRPPVMGYPIQVRADGTITLPYLGKVKVDGLTLSELEEKLEKDFIGEEILMEGKTVIMASMIREAPTVATSLSGPSASGSSARGGSALVARPLTAAATSGVRESYVANMKSPSDFTEREATLVTKIAQARAGIGPGGIANPTRQLEALRKEHRLVLSMIESDLKLAESRLVQAEEEAAFAQTMLERGFSTQGDSRLARIAVTEAEVEVKQLNQLREAYRGALQGEKRPEVRGKKNPKDSAAADKPGQKPMSVSGGAKSTPRITFNFQEAAWPQVLKGLAETCGLSLDLHDRPTGTFNYVASNQYTPRQAVDIVNGYLLREGFLTVQKDKVLVVWAFDNGLPPSLVPEASPEDLKIKYSEVDNMLLTVSFKVDGDVEQLAREIDVMLEPYPFVRIAALTNSQTLIVTDLSSNLRKVAKLIEGPALLRKGFADRFVRKMDSPSEFAAKEVAILALVESSNTETKREATRRLKSLRNARNLVIELIESDVAIAQAVLKKSVTAYESAKKRPANYSRDELAQMKADVEIHREQLKRQLKLLNAYKNSSKQAAKTSNETSASKSDKARARIKLQQILNAHKPKRADAVYTELESIEGVKLEVRKTGENSGYYVTDADGRLVRRFIDTNGDGKVDRYEYFKAGIKRYEDVDTDFNDKIDTFHYYANDGVVTRTLVDRDGDGEPDEQSDSGD